MIVERLSVSLPADLVEAVREAVESGRYASLSEVVREALRDWQLRASTMTVKSRRRNTPSATDLLPSQLLDIEDMALFRRIERFGIRGSARKRVVEAAIAFRPPLPYRWTPEEARADTEGVLSTRWMRQVNLMLFDSVADPTEWTVVYESYFCGSDTDSSSTS